MPDYKQSLIRKLKVKSSELKEELNFIQGIYEVCVNDFCLTVSNFCEENNLKNPLLDLKPKDEEPSNPVLDDELKSLFREIAKKTHSDLTGTENSRPILEDAVRAKKENKSSDLLSIAHNLSIDTSSLTYKSIEAIEASISDLEQEMSNITNSYPWVWYHASDNRKIKIIQEFVDSKV